MNQGIVWAFMGTGFTFLMTAFGASVVFILKNDMGKKAEVKVTAEAVDYGAESVCLVRSRGSQTLRL